MSLQATDCHTGDTLAEIQAQVASMDDILKNLSQIAVKFRTKAGESLATVEKLKAPTQSGTTASLEAWQAYNKGWGLLLAANFAGSIPLLKHATEVDPNFAMAYATLGRAYNDLGQPGLASEQMTKAYELRDRAS